jgi:hypothetical protein
MPSCGSHSIIACGKREELSSFERESRWYRIPGKKESGNAPSNFETMNELAFKWGGFCTTRLVGMYCMKWIPNFSMRANFPNNKFRFDKETAAQKKKPIFSSTVEIVKRKQNKMVLVELGWSFFRGRFLLLPSDDSETVSFVTFCKLVNCRQSPFRP